MASKKQTPKLVPKSMNPTVHHAKMASLGALAKLPAEHALRDDLLSSTLDSDPVGIAFMLCAVGDIKLAEFVLQHYTTATTTQISEITQFNGRDGNNKLVSSSLLGNERNNGAVRSTVKNSS